jgi:hypothetical protein
MTSFQDRQTRELVEMLSTMRPHSSKAEKRFINKWIRPLGVEQDLAGNLHKRIGNVPVLWSCHTDTVHRLAGVQAIRVDKGWIKLAPISKASCLGADCTIGVWIMREMILANVPGLYIFHRQEECGGKGSAYIADKTPHVLDGINFAIAFDRRGFDSVITHQGSRCCSQAFATSLAARLNESGFKYRPDSSGVFTDTANYTGIIPECTNISVGYEHEHSPREKQHVHHAFDLLQAMLSLDVQSLPVSRDVGESDFSDAWLYRSKGKNRFFDSDWSTKTYDQMSELCKDYPDECAEILRDYGLSEADLIDYIFEKTGRLVS